MRDIDDVVESLIARSIDDEFGDDDFEEAGYDAFTEGEEKSHEQHEQRP